MHKIALGVAEASAEKHTPVYEVDGKTVHVLVGSVAHPMNQDHYIQWICLDTRNGVHYRVLTPGDKPEARFALCDGEEVVGVYAFCNQHSLWKS